MSETGDSGPSRPGLAARTFLLGFDRIVRGLFRIEESGLPERVPACCLIVANHRRDADIPILGVFLGRARGRRITGVLPHFVAREDLFDPGFLWHYWRSPWLVLPRLISPLIPLARILRVFKAHPIHRIPEQSLEIVLRDYRHYLGEQRLDEVVSERWLGRFAEAGIAADRPIGWLLKRARRFERLIGGGWGHRRLRLAAFRRFKPVERKRIADHLAVFEQALARGEAVMLAPEGANSPDGHFQRPRAGAWRIARSADDDLPILPVGLSYDPTFNPAWVSRMGMRTRVFVHAGPPFRLADYADRRRFDEAVAKGILHATTVTGSHLLAHYVLRAAPGEHLTPATAEAFARELGDALESAGLRVAADAAQHMRARLSWFARAGLLERHADGWRRSRAGAPAPGWESRGALAVFLRNELASVTSLAPGLSAQYDLALPPYAPWCGQLRGTTWSVCYT